MFLKNHRYIFLNQDLSPHEKKLVMAHELGHAILHRKENCYFIRNKTFLSTNRIEMEANYFAAELLISDQMIAENQYLTLQQLSRLLGYSEKILEMKVQRTL